MAGVPILIPALFAANGSSPASGAKIYSFIKGTSTPQQIFTSDDLATPATNPIICNSLAAKVFYLDPAKNVDLVAKTSDDATTLFSVTYNASVGLVALGTGWEDILELPAAGILDNLAGVRFVATYAALKALTTATGLADSAAYQMLYYATEGDLGGGTFYYKSDLSSQVVFSTKTVSSVDTGTDVLTATAHGFWTEDVVIASAADAGLSLNTLYYVRWASANTITLHTSVLGARNNTGLVNITALAGSLSLKKLNDPGQGVYVIPTGAALDGSGGGFARAWDGLNAQFSWWGVVAGVAADQFEATQAAIYFAGVRGGASISYGAGTFRYDNTPRVSKANVVILGIGGDQSHDGGTGVDGGTKLAWYASGGTMFEFKTPYGVSHSKIVGCGFRDIEMNGRAVAAKGLVIDTVANSLFSRCHVQDVTSVAYEMTCGISSTDIAEAADTQRCAFEYLTCRMIDTAPVQSAVGFRLTGTTSSANTSFNQFYACRGLTYNGDCWDLVNADNNFFLSCVSQVIGSGWGFTLRGIVTGVSVGAGLNYFLRPSWGSSNGCRMLGVASGYNGPADRNAFVCIDNGNGAQLPTVDADVVDYTASRDDGVNVGRNGYVGLVAAGGVSGVATGYTNKSATCPLFVVENAAVFQHFYTSTYTVGLGVHDSTTVRLHNITGAFDTFYVYGAVRGYNFKDTNNNQVVGTRGAAVADASGGATVDAEARTALNALLARLRTHGLIAT